jgi:hypothetical protein
MQRDEVQVREDEDPRARFFPSECPQVGVLHFTAEFGW